MGEIRRREISPWRPTASIFCPGRGSGRQYGRLQKDAQAGSLSRFLLDIGERGASCQGHFLWIYLNFFTTCFSKWMNKSNSDWNSPCIDRLVYWITLTRNSEIKKNCKKKCQPTCPTYGVSCRKAWGKLAADDSTLIELALIDGWSVKKKIKIEINFIGFIYVTWKAQLPLLVKYSYRTNITVLW
jgi:hypothetical protein